MGYSRISTGPGFLNYVQPFIDQMPKHYGDQALSLRVETDSADSASYHWRNYLNVAMIKAYFRVSVKLDITDPTYSWIVIKSKKVQQPGGDVSKAIRGEPQGGPAVTQKEMRTTIKLSRIEFDESVEENKDPTEITITTDDIRNIMEQEKEREQEKPKPKHATFAMFDKPEKEEGEKEEEENE